MMRIKKCKITEFRHLRRLHSKKGQITVFMILGIILLFSTALIFYIKGRVQIPEEDIVPSLEAVPDVLKPVRTFIEECAGSQMDKGLVTAMEHGGMIYAEDLSVDTANPTEGEGVEYFPGSNYKIPYWSYMESSNDCTSGCVIGTKMPPLCKAGRIGCMLAGEGSVEEQLERYLEEEMKSCTGDFQELRRQGYIIKELSNITASVSIREKDAVALIRYDLEVEKDGTRTEIADYYASTPTKITEMYDIAVRLVNYSTANCFYEGFTLDQISTYSGLDSDLPPLFETVFGGQKERWMMFKVREKMNQILTNMIQLIRYNNTYNFDTPNIDASGEYKRTKEAVLERTVSYALRQEEDVEISTRYLPWWHMYLEISPSISGPSNEMSSQDTDVIGELIKVLGYKEYIYSYSNSYPIVTEISFENELGEDKVFRYAQEVNLRGGTCMSPSTQLLSSSGTVSQTLLCDHDMREEKNTTIVVYDDFNRTKPLEGVEVFFYAGETCDLGVTDSKGKLTVQMPKAIGYFLTFTKEGYLKNIVHESDITKPVKEYLKPILTKKVHVYSIDENVTEKIRSVKTTLEASNLVRNSSKELNQSTDMLILNIERIKETYRDPEFKKVIQYDAGSYDPQEIEITTGTYLIDIKMIDKRNHTLARELDRTCEEDRDADGSCVKTPVDPDCRPRGDSLEDFHRGDCYMQGYTCESAEDARDKNSKAEDDDYEACVWSWILGGIGSDECRAKKCKTDEEILYPEENITNILIGGIVLDNTSMYYELTDPGQLIGADEIIFYVFRQRVPRRHHELDELNKHIEWSKKYATYVMPRLR